MSRTPSWQITQEAKAFHPPTTTSLTDEETEAPLRDWTGLFYGTWQPFCLWLFSGQWPGLPRGAHFRMGYFGTHLVLTCGHLLRSFTSRLICHLVAVGQAAGLGFLDRELFARVKSSLPACTGEITSRSDLDLEVKWSHCHSDPTHTFLYR